MKCQNRNHPKSAGSHEKCPDSRSGIRGILHKRAHFPTNKAARAQHSAEPKRRFLYRAAGIGNPSGFALIQQAGVARILISLLQELGNALRARGRVGIELRERRVRGNIVRVDGNQVFQRRGRAAGIAGADIGVGGVDGRCTVRGCLLYTSDAADD